MYDYHQCQTAIATTTIRDSNHPIDLAIDLTRHRVAIGIGLGLDGDWIGFNWIQLDWHGDWGWIGMGIGIVRRAIPLAITGVWGWVMDQDHGWVLAVKACHNLTRLMIMQVLAFLHAFW